MLNKEESANRITSNIMRVVNMQPHCSAAHISVVGIYDDKIGKRRKSNSTKGVEDIICCIHGLYIGFEVKAGKDRQSDDQKKREFDINRSKGKYYIIRSTNQFLQIFTQILNQIKENKTIL